MGRAKDLLHLTNEAKARVGAVIFFQDSTTWQSDSGSQLNDDRQGLLQQVISDIGGQFIRDYTRPYE